MLKSLNVITRDDWYIIPYCNSPPNVIEHSQHVLEMYLKHTNNCYWKHNRLGRGNNSFILLFAELQQSEQDKPVQLSFSTSLERSLLMYSCKFLALWIDPLNIFMIIWLTM